MAFATAISAAAQAVPNEPDQPARVSVTVNPDGTRTAYQFDQAHRKATATITSAAGKVTQKIKYDIDEAGRFSTGIVTGPNDKFLYKTVYKYTPEGRLGEETHLDKDDNVVNKLVYSYDANGRPTGYVVYDGLGNVIGRTSPVQTKSASPRPEKKKR
jgi:YD repeat-containing protein